MGFICDLLEARNKLLKSTKGKTISDDEIRKTNNLALSRSDPCPVGTRRSVIAAICSCPVSYQEDSTFLEKQYLYYKTM